MPHKYQREIEEILRNMEQSEPLRGPDERVRSIPRPTSSPPRPRRRMATHVRATSLELLMGVSVVLALVAGGLAFTAGPSIVSGAIGIAAFAVFAFACVASWANQAQSSRAPRVWRGNTVEPTPIGMRHRGLFSEIATQMRILKLKWRYWRSHER